MLQEFAAMHSALTRFLPVLCLLGFTLTARAADRPLLTFFQKPEPVYHWEKRGESTVGDCKVYDLHLVSQVWHGITWEHRLQVFRPQHLDHADFCTLYNTGGNGGSGDLLLGTTMARSTGAVYAILSGIPNQPLFDGRKEDALVAYTWLRYMETEDPTWPLHFPMAKAVLKSMDAVQEFSRKEGFPEVKRFLIHGASKRGWTTWLAGASGDPRIRAIAPMVIDSLNVRKQGPHQLAAYGKYSEQIEDYTREHIPEKLETPRGRQLMELEDPYSYRDRLTLPKLIILGTNDRYWAQDALNIYWDGLRGPKWVLYTPNSGHGLEDRSRVLATLAAFARATAANEAMPKLHWAYHPERDGIGLSVESSPAPKEWRLFHTQAKTQDFRDSHWSYDKLPASGAKTTIRRAPPSTGYEAMFVEAVYESNGVPYTLSTQLRVLSPQEAR